MNTSASDAPAIRTLPRQPSDVDAKALAQREHAIRFVLHGAWVKKFKRQGKQLAPHSVFLRMAPDANKPTVEWGAGRREVVEAVDGGLFGDDFRGDVYFDKHRAEESLCFSLVLEKRTLFFLALSLYEKERWVIGLRTLIDEWSRDATAEERAQHLLRQQSERGRSLSLPPFIPIGALTTRDEPLQPSLPTPRRNSLMRALGLGSPSTPNAPSPNVGGPSQPQPVPLVVLQPLSPVAPPAERSRLRSQTEPRLPTNGTLVEVVTPRVDAHRRTSCDEAALAAALHAQHVAAQPGASEPAGQLHVMSTNSTDERRRSITADL